MSGREGANEAARFNGLIEGDRLFADIEAIAEFSESPPEVGYSRPTFSEPWRRARDYIIAQAEAAGGEHRIDPSGNVRIRSKAVGWDRRVWLSGSHIDSVPSGGKYDGVMGVVIPLEIIRAAPELPLELVIFAEEEGTTFGLGMLGSRSWCGTLAVADLAALRNRHGESYLEAGKKHGVEPARLGDEASRLDPAGYFGFVEVHAEQGLSLWNKSEPVAVVTRINGRRQFDITVRGLENHAGSTFMPDRKDALAGAAELIIELEKLGQELHRELPYTVLTVGSIEAKPNASNVISGRVDLKVDFRAQEERMLDSGSDEIRRIAQEVAEGRGLSVEVAQPERLEPSPLNRGVYEALQEAGGRRAVEAPLVPSGALHDAAIIAPRLPTAMVFVASKEGISHNPAEFSRIEDIAKAAELVAELVAGAPEGLDRG